MDPTPPDARPAPAPRAALTGAGATAVDTALGRAREGLAEAGRSWRVIVQATIASSAAYAAASALGHENPFFAPIAAIATVAISLAHRLRRATELVVGNAIGILLADLLVAQIGTGAWQVGLVVAIALTTAVVAGGGPILIMQSSSAAILIATLTPPTTTQPWNTSRFVDALVGGGIGLLVSALLMPVDPARHARSAAAPVLAALTDGYRRVGHALATRDRAEAEAVLTDLRGTDPVLVGFHAGLAATRESVRLAPWYWGQQALLASYVLAGVHLDNALRNLRVLARQATVALDRGEAIADGIPQALAALAGVADGLDAALPGDIDPGPVRRLVIEAVAYTAGAPGSPGGQPGGVFSAPMVAQIRLSASDLLQATGWSSDAAAAAIRAAADVSR